MLLMLCYSAMAASTHKFCPQGTIRIADLTLVAASLELRLLLEAADAASGSTATAPATRKHELGAALGRRPGPRA